MLLRFLFTLAEHLDTSAVDQQMQSCRRRMRPDRHSQMFLAPADGTEIGSLRIQAGQPEQALRHAHCLSQRQIEQATNLRAKLNRRFAVRRAAPRLPLAPPCQRMSLSSQTSSDPRALNASLYSFQLVVRYFGLVVALMP